MQNRQASTGASVPNFGLSASPAEVVPEASRYSIESFSRLQDVSPATRELLELESERRFFNGLSWYQLLCDTCLEDGQEPVFHVVVSTSDERTQLVLPMLSPLGNPGSAVSTRPLGSGTAMAMTNYQTVQYGPISDAFGDELVSLIEELAVHLKGRGYALLDFNHLDPTIPANSMIEPAFRRAGYVTCAYIDEAISFEMFDGRGYDDYMASRSSNLRKNVRRRRAALDKAGDVDFVLTKGPDGLERAIEDYERVQKASWKAEEKHVDHVPGLIRAAAAAGHLRLGLLYLDGQPVATDLTVVSGGKATSKKAHYDLDMRQHHVGDILTSYMLEYLLDQEEVTSLDFGKSVVDYKQKWLKEQRQLQGFVAYDPKSIQGQFQGLRFRSNKLIRSKLSLIKGKLLDRGG